MSYALTILTEQFAEVVEVLQSREFAAGFGLAPAPSGGSWPLGLAVSGDGAMLVHAIATARTPATAMNQGEFLTMQRVAHFGATTIREIAAHNAETDDVIGLAYRWHTAIRDLGTRRVAGAKA